MQIDLRHGDCVEVMKTLADASVDAVVTDPPYELGFMGKKWDASGIAYNVDLWREALRVLKPGGHLLAFGGTRTYHRMAVAIEDAGFEIRDSLHWIYGSGFPKSLDVSKAIDKAAGVERQVIGIDASAVARQNKRPTNTTQCTKSAPENVGIITAPATDDARRWSGWGTALKPAHEPVVVARKPLVGTVAANVQAHGTGALNIDGCRVEGAPRNPGFKAPSSSGIWGGADNTALVGYESPSGRWPPNILLSHTPECGETCAEDCSVAEMDRQSGKVGNHGGAGTYASKSGFGGGVVTKAPADSGGASRFFPVFRYQAKASRSERGVYLTCDCKAGSIPSWVNEVRKQQGQMDATLPPRGICAETTAADCDCSTLSCGSECTGQCRPDGKSITLTKTNLTIDRKTSDSSRQSSTSGSTVDASFATESGSSHAEFAESASRLMQNISTSQVKGGRCTGVAVPATSESLWRGKSCDDCGAQIKFELHATVKPVELMRWLVRLVTPPAGVVLEPFMGSGTTGVACVQEGFGFVGIEREAEYFEICKARIAAAQAESPAQKELFSA